MKCSPSQIRIRRITIVFRLSAFACLGMLVMVSGCQKTAAPDYVSLGLAEVSGTIRLDEKPLAKANVIFESEDETYSSGRTNINGKYTLMFNSEKSGVMTGDKVVRIQLGRITEEGDEETEGDDEEAAPVVADSSELPASYNRDSQLRATVVAGVHTIDFDLSSDGSTADAEN